MSFCGVLNLHAAGEGKFNMPIYEYQCTACNHALEAMQKISDAPLRKCPACGKNKLTKLVSAAGFQLKGSGWYVTDFKNKPKETETAKKETPTTKTDDTKK
jgi:putative FmdB family regulatory protein